MSNENFKGREKWGQREGASPTFLMGISVILLCKVYGTVEHPETDFLRYVSGENRFFNPTNTTKYPNLDMEVFQIFVHFR